MRIGFLLGVSVLSGLFLACSKTKQDCVCTTELRINFCVTVNGSQEIPDSLTIVRERKGQLDTLAKGEGSRSCFFEAPGKSALQVFKNGALVREVKGIKVKTVNCCHGEPKTVDIALP